MLYWLYTNVYSQFHLKVKKSSRNSATTEIPRNITDNDNEDVKADNDVISLDVELYVEFDEEESNNQSLYEWNHCNISQFCVVFVYKFIAPR